jgi:ATP-dependent DNA ligase
MEQLTLYRKHSTGQIGTWHIHIDGPVLRYGHAVVEGGSVSWFADPIVLNNSGRPLITQAQLELDSRVRRMLQRGYKTTREEAIASNGKNQYGYALPMLAHPIDRVGVPTNVQRMWVQPKFDGHRALTVFDERHEMYSRKGTPIRSVGSVDHIMSTIDQVLPPDVALDGELYVHGVKLQTIGSWVKRKQADSLRLEYIVYDVVMDEHYSTRFEVLKDVGRLLAQANSAINVAFTREIGTLEDAYLDFHRWRKLGYEGAMLRLDGRSYQPGVRSSALLKIKDRESGEFPIVGVTATKVGANVVLRAPNGKTFETPAPGTHAEKAMYLTDHSIWRDRQMTCEWAHWTNDGLPFHCIALQIREDV